MAETAADALLDKVGFDRLERMAEDAGAKRIADFLLSAGEDLEPDLPKRLIGRLAASIKSGLAEALAALAFPVLASLIIRLLLGREDGALSMLCRLACACELARRCADAISIAGAAMSKAARAADTVSPVLTALLTVTGSATFAASLSPVAALCVSVIENALVAVGLPMCAIAAIVATAGGLSDRFRLDGLFMLLKRSTVWGIRLLIAAFVGLLAVEGRLAAARDTASANALRQALRGMIPYIGGSVSDSTGALLESAAAARGAVGVTGIALACAACFNPVLRLMIHMLSLRLAAAVIEPVADPGIARIASGFSDVSGMLVALCAGSALLAALLAGACLGFA